MRLKRLVDRATDHLQALGFQGLDDGGGERHGAFEWTWTARRDEGGNAYVSLAALGQATESDAGPLTLEIWAGADDGLHFCRYPVETFPASGEGDIEASESLQERVVLVIERAAEEAKKLPSASMTESYAGRSANEPSGSS